ncbi:MAG: hypothetical protein KBD63_05490 [Bacteriovoracaceae bacterium]|nr:hypothetical protein [Bacteriovoracaceae bacterium]
MKKIFILCLFVFSFTAFAQSRVQPTKIEPIQVMFSNQTVSCDGYKEIEEGDFPVLFLYEGANEVLRIDGMYYNDLEFFEDKDIESGLTEVVISLDYPHSTRQVSFDDPAMLIEYWEKDFESEIYTDLDNDEDLSFSKDDE